MSEQIILRARQTYLLGKFRKESETLSLDLLAQIQTAWQTYVRSKVYKGLASEDVSTSGSEWESWPALLQRYNDSLWKAECLKRDAKFEMQFSAAVGVY